jgi:hypothetical protein
MRRLTSMLVLVAALVSVQAVAAADAKPPTLINVYSVSLGKPVSIDVAPKGASKGDKIVFKDDLVNAVAQFGKPKGAKVGADAGTLTFLSKSSARFDGKTTLPGGTLTLNGPVFSVSGGGMTIPVSGGTGRYKGARGLLIVGPGARSLNTYRLVYPTPKVA